MLKVVEIFRSIEGEGVRAGYPAIFIRLYGCNHRCSYCDSQYACTSNEYTEMTVDEIIRVVDRLDKRRQRVTITGGEPLLQFDVITLIHYLLNKGIEVNVETNGSVDITPLNQLPYREKLLITMDWKSLSSGMSEYNHDPNLLKLKSHDVLKFVVGTEEDLEQMGEVVKASRSSEWCSAQKFVSPVFGKIEPKRMVEYLLENDLNEVRVQLQLHKYIWDPETRGV